jgi:hypothetical protein
MTIQSITEQDVLKYKLQTDLYFFTRYFYKQFNKSNFIRSDHFQLLSDVLEKVYTHEISRLIINLPPRHGKTEMAVINFIAKGLMINPKAKFIHTSYSEALALDNSEKIKEFVQSDEFQAICPITISVDSKSKKKWYTDQGGGMMATSSGGQITGFGAGLMDTDDFGGAIIIDDPIKPDDAYSETIRTSINERFFNTMLSRVNNPKTPIIIIMQRLHENDLCGYLMNQEPGEWEVISMPVIKEDGTALWSDKHTIEELYKLRAANEFVFDTQYMQDPKPRFGLLFPKDELQRFRRSDIDIKNKVASIAFVDVADTGSDNHCAIFGKIIGIKIYIDDVVFTKEPTETNTVMTIQASLTETK